MISGLTWALVALCAVIVLVAGFYAWRDRLIDDKVLALFALVEIGILVQLVAALTHLTHVSDVDERLTLVAYLVSLPVVPMGTAFLAIKEKTRWAMAALAIGAFAVAVMMVRCQQIWDGPGA